MTNVPSLVCDFHTKSDKGDALKIVRIFYTNNFRNISTNSLIQVSVCRGSYDGYVKHKRNDPMFDP